MIRHIITLPNGRQCSVGIYARAWQALKALPPDSCSKGFGHHPERADYILSRLRFGMHDRINRHVPDFGVGRKWGDDYQTHLYRDSRRLRDIANRIRVYQFESAEARARFSHLLADRSE